MPLSPAGAGLGRPRGAVARSRTARRISARMMSGSGSGARPSFPERLAKASSAQSAQAWSGRSLGSCFVLCLAFLLSAGGAAVGQEGENLDALSRTASARGADPAHDALRVCADPNNLPFSNARREGFENTLAELVAGELGKTVSYTWWAQRRGFIRNTLNAGACDLIMGVPQLDVIATTRPYYESTYVFVSRKDRALDFSSIQAPELKTLRVGVHLIGDDGASTPPTHALGEQGITDKVVGYMIYGDYREDSPPARLIEAVERGEIDVAAVWGPLAGYFAQRSPIPLNVVPITGTEPYRPLVFQFPIAMGVRKADRALADRLNEIIERRQDDIQALLNHYGVPLVERGGDALTATDD
jgi:mxaJ protein